MLAHVKVCNEMKQKSNACVKNVIDGRKHFIKHIQKTGEDE